MTKSVIIGVAGGSGSGKTTLSVRLTEALGAGRCTRIEHDSYYRVLSDAQRASAKAGAYNFDHPDALETSLLIEHLNALREGRDVTVPEYDFATHGRKATGKHIEPRPIIVVDGILALSVPELKDLCDHRVFVDAPEHVRLFRRIARDTAPEDQGGRGRTLPEVLHQYFSTVRPAHYEWVESVLKDRSNVLVIDGTAEFGAVVDDLIARLAL